MSSRQLEERQERERLEAIAKALGMSVDELEAQEWSIDENVGNDGTIYSHVVTLEDGRTAHIQLPD